MNFFDRIADEFAEAVGSRFRVTETWHRNRSRATASLELAPCETCGHPSLGHCLACDSDACEAHCLVAPDGHILCGDCAASCYRERRSPRRAAREPQPRSPRQEDQPPPPRWQREEPEPAPPPPSAPSLGNVVATVFMQPAGYVAKLASGDEIGLFNSQWQACAAVAKRIPGGHALRWRQPDTSVAMWVGELPFSRQQEPPPAADHAEQREQHLAALGLSGHPTEAKIKSRFRELARQWHPDRAPANKRKQHEERFMSLVAAKEWLVEAIAS